MSISKSAALEALREAADELGHAPTVEEYRALDLSPSYNTIIKRCGGWNASLEHLDVDFAGAPPVLRRGMSRVIREATKSLSDSLGYLGRLTKTVGSS